ncbi:type-F conjugative transfer system protein TrbI [Scandinavium sp. NPDC088450]|uniref:type-F conjugative transfer system protein TrbI n=1 Tax=Scandinavium sp. NPDC088450 TaxID=3364514 RepID=UPI00384CB2CF
MGESRMSEPDNTDNATGKVTSDTPDTVKESLRPGYLASPLLRHGLLSVMLAVIVVGTAWLTARTVAPEVVVFDMKGTMDLFIQQALVQKLPENQSKRLMMRFNRAMTDSLQAWQANHHAVILVAAAVVSSQPDITLDIRNDIAQRMQAGGQ